MVKKKPAKFDPTMSPRQFLRSRRPERFSDSVVVNESGLDRSLLEYHLDTITNRNQEVAFASFARRLAELEICPNLLPQTGPTGGGDSKVDSETYPVADQIAAGWSTGIGPEAASERWGFAFSAKRDWRAKAASDLRKMVGTGRDYAKAFFVSNQYIPDKGRAEVEDKLRKELGVDIRILDRTWILDKVFGNGRELLAIEELNLSASTRKEVRRGPLDLQREQRREIIEERIQHALREGQQGFRLAEDCIEVADLARQLERPRVEIDGLYERAERIVAECGTEHQRIECAYKRAWTAFWWYEDYAGLNHFYEIVENRAKGSRNAYHIELLHNIWQLFHTSVVSGRFEAGRPLLAKRTEVLLAELARLSELEDQPSTVLQAQSLQSMVQLSLNLASKVPVEPVLARFQEIVSRSEGLVGFPLESLIDFLIEFGDLHGSSPAYDSLYDSLVESQTRRKGDVAAARMLARRGEQHLMADRPYDAIRSLGLSLRRLYKHESREDLIHALYLCGCAFDEVGLLWAARGLLLSAASIATADWWKYGEISRLQGACYNRLKWIELRLGRIPQILAWHELHEVVRNVLADKGALKKEISEREFAFDMILGIYFLKADQWELNRLAGIPDALGRLALTHARAALLYALGYELQLRNEFIPDDERDEDVFDLFKKWRDQPAAQEFAAKLSLYDQRKVTLNSNLLGCHIEVKSENASPSLELAESILAGLESMLATGVMHSMAAREPTLTIEVKSSEFAELPFEYTLQDESGRPHLEVICGAIQSSSMSREEQQEFKKKLFELLTAICARIIVANNISESLERLFRDELVLDRSIDFSASFVTVANVLGSKPKASLSDWEDRDFDRYPPKRILPWDASDHSGKKETAPKPKPLTPGRGEIPEAVIDDSRLKQTEMKTVSLIREVLWDKAKWGGTAFMAGYDDTPPMLGLIFGECEVAKQIFKGLQSDIGQSEADERLRVTIIRGINKSKPAWYRLVLSSNLDGELKDIRRFVAVSRIHTMTPDSDANLQGFLDSYSKAEQYILAGVCLDGSGKYPQLINSPQLVLRALSVRQAWEIGRHDPDLIGILEDDDPVIPPNQKQPPIVELLRWKRNQSRGST
jgi:hypothetical protein